MPSKKAGAGMLSWDWLSSSYSYGSALVLAVHKWRCIHRHAFAHNLWHQERVYQNRNAHSSDCTSIVFEIASLAVQAQQARRHHIARCWRRRVLNRGSAFTTVAIILTAIQLLSDRWYLYLQYRQSAVNKCQKLWPWNHESGPEKRP